MTWKDILDRKLRENAPVEITGHLTGSVMEKYEAGKRYTCFSVMPGTDVEYAPIVDGDAVLHVEFEGALNDIDMYRLMHASRSNGRIKVEGKYVPQEEDVLGLVRASAMEF